MGCFARRTIGCNHVYGNLELPRQPPTCIICEESMKAFNDINLLLLGNLRFDLSDAMSLGKDSN